MNEQELHLNTIANLAIAGWLSPEETVAASARIKGQEPSGQSRRKLKRKRNEIPLANTVAHLAIAGLISGRQAVAIVAQNGGPDA